MSWWKNLFGGIGRAPSGRSPDGERTAEIENEAIQVSEGEATGSPSLVEDQRKAIFADFKETHDTEFLLGTNIAQEVVSWSTNLAGGLGDLSQSIDQNAEKADAATYAKIGNKYGLGERELRALVQEGEEKKWPFRGVA